jgi:hypothetical protein
MRILAIIGGEYGRRHVENIREKGPEIRYAFKHYPDRAG